MMNQFWVVAALAGLGSFLGCLGAAAWRGQDSAGRWRPGAWRWLLGALASFALLTAGLRLAGVEPTGLHYPAPSMGASGGNAR